MKTLAITLHTGKSQQILSQRRVGLATQRWDDNGFGTALADSPSLQVGAAFAITHFTTPQQVQLPLQEQELLLHLQQELPLLQPLPLLPWLHPQQLLAWPLGVSLGCQGTPQAHHPRWQRQKRHSPHNISPR